MGVVAEDVASDVAHGAGQRRVGRGGMCTGGGLRDRWSLVLSHW